jgi:hypothetical protein
MNNRIFTALAALGMFATIVTASYMQTASADTFKFKSEATEDGEIKGHFHSTTNIKEGEGEPVDEKQHFVNHCKFKPGEEDSCKFKSHVK